MHNPDGCDPQNCTDACESAHHEAGKCTKNMTVLMNVSKNGQKHMTLAITALRSAQKHMTLSIMKPMNAQKQMTLDTIKMANVQKHMSFVITTQN